MNELNNNMDNSCDLLIKENKLLINGFSSRLIDRIINIFNNYNIKFNREKLYSMTNEYLTNNLKNISFEMSISYKKLLHKYFDIVNEYYHNNKNSKERVKSITKAFIDKLFKKENPLLNVKVCSNYINELKGDIYIYDNNNLIKEIESKIKSDTILVIEEIKENNNKYLTKCMKDILTYILKGEE